MFCAAGLLLDVVAQVDVRQEENRLFGRNRIHHVDRVARRADDVALGLHLERGVDVAHHDVIGVGRLPGRAPAPPGRRPPDCIRLRDPERRRLRSGFSTLAVSAMNQTPQKAITSPSNVSRLARQLQAVADGVGQFLNLGFLVVMRQHDRVALALQLEDLVSDGGCGRHGVETDSIVTSYFWMSRCASLTG